MMEIVGELTISKTKSPSNGKSGNCKRGKQKRKRSDDEKRLIESLIRENNEIYKTAKKRGYALPEEKGRALDIRLELIRMKAI